MNNITGQCAKIKKSISFLKEKEDENIIKSKTIQ